MSSTFPNLFRPLKLAHLTLKNRIVFGAHTANMAECGCQANGIAAITRSAPAAAPR